MIERRQSATVLRADADYANMAGYDTVRVPLDGATRVAVTAILLSSTWQDIDVRRAHAGRAPEAFGTPLQLTTGARSVLIDADDLLGAGELVITPAAYSSGHRAEIVVTVEVETSPGLGARATGGGT